MDSRRRRRLSPALLLLLLAAAHLSLSSSFTPATNVLLNCGSTESSSPPDDNRSFLPDASFSGDSTPILSPDNSSSSLYRSARVSTSSFTYELSLSSPGDHALRLHFFPFSASGRDLSSAKFEVFASDLLLLQNPVFPLGGGVIKEFFLRLTGTKIRVSFRAAAPAAAFVSAVELFSLPRELLPADARWAGLSGQTSLQTLHRVNAGGPLVAPAEDTLWRRWLPDEEFVVDLSVSKIGNTSGAINYAGNGAGLSPEVAPATVYRTLREMNKGAAPDPQINITWKFAVAAGDSHLVRMHFCDVVSTVPSDLVFNSYVDRRNFYPDLRLTDLVGGELAPVYYQEVVAGGSSPEMLITVGRSQSSTPSTANAILNGVEIFRVLDGSGGGAAAAGEKSSSAAAVAGGVAGGVVILLVLAALGFWLVRRRRSKKRLQPETKDSEMSSWWSPLPGHSAVSGVSSGGAAGSLASRQPMNLGLIISLEEILAATNNFDESLIVGSGGFGNVYRGILRDGTKVAIKRATPGSSQGYPEFQAEVLLLSKIRHKHLVSLVGYCDEQGQMILVYEFMENGTLKGLIYGGAAAAPPWKQRLEICIGSARGIHYLHTGDAQAIIHRDLKTSNILLDGELVAKVSDFGLSRAGPAVGRTHVSTAVKGSFGYLDPEYFRTQQLTDKSDVYSFGVVLLEVLCARAVIDPQLAGDELNLAEWAVIKHRRGRIEDIIDPRLNSEASISTTSLKKFAETAIRCLEPYGDDRPAIGDVLWNLEYCLQLQRSSETKRDPFDDSGVVETQFPVPVPLRRVPSIGEEEDDDDDETQMAGENLDFTASKAFSQIVTREGR